jgi:hypothetical protein
MEVHMPGNLKHLDKIKAGETKFIGQNENGGETHVFDISSTFYVPSTDAGEIKLNKSECIPPGFSIVMKYR